MQKDSKKDTEQCALHSVMQAKGEPLPDYELDYCNKCMQMTNHLDGICQKCKGN